MSERRDYPPDEGFAEDFLPGDGPEADAAVRPPRRRLRLLPRVLLWLLVTLGIALVLNATLFRIRHVSVVGNRNIPADTIAALADIRPGMGFFSINEAHIREGIEQNPYLQLIRIQRAFPDTMALVVKERAPFANIQGVGALYLVDEDGYVLNKIEGLTPQNSLPVVIGMQVSEARTGRQILSSKEGKVDEYRTLIGELRLQGAVNLFNQINLTDDSHIYLRHTDGMIADIGTLSELMAKIGTLRAVINEISRSGPVTGFADVTIPGEAIYSP